MLLNTPVGRLFPLALLFILGGTFLIGLIAKHQKQKEEKKKLEEEHLEKIRKSRLHSKHTRRQK